ncbi:MULTISPECIES: N-acetylmuramoyl-L-alanine amidase [Bacteroides]|jgi:N-acetylmuramoyl-L-alanine amidase|uniref:N-acetylmuramoyl-L-alanine amidase n=1 Tax=Bacteroides TaxID=816 RepID=UPI000E4F9FD3|nr:MULTISPECIES: N-acetylmuramoyl-L-alanine amidase [Bacteroides]UVY25354.1 MAG: N-acetylmuramoyl-L-alanine amidase [Bacteriophage sp.]MCS2601713.1 N-acetylmuramoyl-L-alanine amidase [Bacteroides thetaiotaomicron]MCS3035190.1 N-acetylmuramoyl-L-alanine amidase [Bacteroides ovatus]MDC2129277.1 N-acetylmuramoyl-L-alanine amidase [Bacteroides thetaiotaomicron]MDC2134093.1 N-acetylmuramoyl-L-alanine amidase [Bacteroides thetaiotaomicron]
MKILIDNGHGENTPGKRSPDGKLREYLYAREIAESVERALRAKGYDVERIVHEIIDVPLAERARRVNEICARYGATNVLLVSIHCNAAGNGEWMSARGWSAYTSKGKTKSDELATMLYEEAEQNFAGQKIRRDNSDGDPDWEENFYILVKTKCPAVLTENFFQDNKEDVAFLNSDEGKQAIIKTHVDAIIKYVTKYGKT